MRDIKLRAVEPCDVDFMFDCENDPEAARWTDYRAPLSRRQLLDYAVNYDADPFAAGQLRLIIETSDGQPVGILDIYEINEKDSRGYVGICVHKDERRSGIASAAIRELMEYNRQTLGLGQLVAKVAVVNVAARNLFVKEGFEKIATLPRWHRMGTSFHDIDLFSRNFE